MADPFPTFTPTGPGASPPRTPTLPPRTGSPFNPFGPTNIGPTGVPLPTSIDDRTAQQQWADYAQKYSDWAAQFGGHPGDFNMGLGVDNAETDISRGMPIAPTVARPDYVPGFDTDPALANQPRDAGGWILNPDGTVKEGQAGSPIDPHRFDAQPVTQNQNWASVFGPNEQQNQRQQQYLNRQQATAPTSWEQSSTASDPFGNVFAARGRSDPFSSFTNWRAPNTPGSAGQWANKQATTQQTATGQRPWWG